MMVKLSHKMKRHNDLIMPRRLALAIVILGAAATVFLIEYLAVAA